MTNQMKVLVAYDGSNCADSAVEDLRRAGLPENAQLTVLSVVESWLPPPSGLEVIEHIDRDKEYLALARRGMLELHGALPGWDVKTEVGFGSPGSVVIEKANELGADLIVVGSHGRSTIGQLFFGSVSQKILHDAHCSVRVGRERPKNKTDEPLKLIVAVDGSKGAEAAVEVVASRKWPAGAEVRVVNAGWAIPQLTSQHMTGPIIDWITTENARVKKAVEAAVAGLAAAGLKVEAVIKEEEPKRLLISEAESWGADCIFMGARGMGRLERFLIGSVSSGVAARAHCSVEVVRH